jgi:hypothetical protein
MRTTMPETAAILSENSSSSWVAPIITWFVAQILCSSTDRLAPESLLMSASEKLSEAWENRT